MYNEDFRRTAREMLGSGWSINGVHRELGVARATLRAWRTSPERAGAKCPAPADATPDYTALFGFYLGDGCLSRARRTYALRISCDAALPGIVADVARCTLAVHPERRTYRVAAPGVVVVQSSWNHWPCLFPQHGPGRKHDRELTMTPWQRAIVDEYPAALLRGLFHSDGCRVANWATRTVAGERKRYDYPRWQFSNMSEDIMGWCGEALDLIDVPWRRTSRKILSVSTRAGVARLDELIGAKS